MGKCIVCGDTGKSNSGRYCKCAIGKVQERVARSKAMAEKKKAEENEREKRQRPKVRVNPTKPEQIELLEEKEITIDSPVKLHDWVIVTKGAYKGVIGSVDMLNMNNQKIFVAAIRHVDGHKVSGISTFDYDQVKPYELPMDEDHLLDLIDLAIDTNDEDWFMELTEKLP